MQDTAVESLAWRPERRVRLFFVVDVNKRDSAETDDGWAARASVSLYVWHSQYSYCKGQITSLEYKNISHSDHLSKSNIPQIQLKHTMEILDDNGINITNKERLYSNRNNAQTVLHHKKTQ